MDQRLSSEAHLAGPSGYALSARARDLRDIGREDEALTLFTEAAYEHERVGQPHLAAIALRRAGREDDALAMFGRAVAQAETDGDPYLAAICLREIGEAEAAVARFVDAAAQAEAEGDFSTAISALKAAGRHTEARDMQERVGPHPKPWRRTPWAMRAKPE